MKTTRFLLASLLAALALSALTHAATIQFDLVGKGGSGLRGTNENPAVTWGSGGENGPQIARGTFTAGVGGRTGRI